MVWKSIVEKTKTWYSEKNCGDSEGEKEFESVKSKLE